MPRPFHQVMEYMLTIYLHVWCMIDCVVFVVLVILKFDSIINKACIQYRTEIKMNYHTKVYYPVYCTLYADVSLASGL